MVLTEEMKQSKMYREITQSIGEQMMARMREEQALKVKNYKTLNRLVREGGILFTGSSLMEQFPVTEMAVSVGVKLPVYNRGIGGTTTDDFLREIDTVMLDLAPSVIFINIGTNDMNSQTYGEDIHFMMIDLCDRQRDTPESAAAFLEKEGYSFPAYYDTTGSAVSAYQIFSIPLTVGINREGEIVALYNSPVSEEQLEQLISYLLS